MAFIPNMRRRPTYSSFKAQRRSVADVAARVAPTMRQFRLAVDYNDASTILDYLCLSPSLPDDMDETNAFIMRYKRVPPSRPLPHYHARADDRRDEPDETHAPHTWLWPLTTRSPLGREPITLFTLAARNGFADVLAWFFCGPRDRMERLQATLACVFSPTLRCAVTRRHGHVVEMLLTSPVFHEVLSAAAQQHALNNALIHARDVSLCQALLAHGAATPDALHGRGGSLASGCFSGFLLGDTSDQLWCDLWCKLWCGLDSDVLVPLARHGTVIDHAVLVTAIQRTPLAVVKLVVDKGFVDVDARRSDGRTALMVCASGVVDYRLRAMCLPIMQMLLEANADTTLRDAQGRTALHLAIRACLAPNVEMLLDHVVANYGIEAVHSDHEALALVLERRDAHAELSERVLVALLERGACPDVFDRLSRESGSSVRVAHLAVATHGAMARRPCKVCYALQQPVHRSKRRRIEGVLMP